MNYDENYMLTHDIDFFFIINGIYVHAASAGGILPIELRDRESLRKLQHNVAVAGYVYNEEDLEYNKAFLQQKFSDNPKGLISYIASFTDMARKGFTSFDRTNWQNPDDNHYHIVCRPKRENLDQPVIKGDFKTFINDNRSLFPSVEQSNIKLLDYIKSNFGG